MTFKKERTSKNIKPARKTSALIVAEAKIVEIMERLSKIEDRIWLVIYSSLGGALAAAGTLAVILLLHGQVKV